MAYRARLALGLLLGFLSSPLSAEVFLRFGVYTADKPTTVVEQFRPLLDTLQRSLEHGLNEPVRIKMQVAKDYEQGVQDIVTGQVDLSRLGPASYIKAKDLNPKLSIVAMESEAGTKVFYGIICVRQDSPIRDVKALKGKSFAFGDESSTIGRYLSQLYLVKHGIRASDLRRYEYLGRHDRVGAAVGHGQFDAGALQENTFYKLVREGVPLREIARFPNVTKPWVAREGLPDRIRQALGQALLGIHDSEALKALGIDGFLEGSDEDYALTQQAIHDTHRFSEDARTP